MSRITGLAVAGLIAALSLLMNRKPVYAGLVITGCALAVAACAPTGTATVANTTTAPRPAVTHTKIVYRTAAPKIVYRTAAPKIVYRTATPQPSSAPAAPAQPAQSDPWAVISEYYGDVTSGDYADAWSLLGPGMRAQSGSYAAFVAGYAGTGAQDVYEVGESGDAVTYYLFSVNPDGSTQYYEGTAQVYGGQITSTDVTQLAGNPRA